MGAVASFNYAAWIARYPEFASVSSGQATMLFSEATLYLANDGSGPVADAGQQLTLLNMLTAHIAALYVGVSGQPPSGLVGRINSATEGSVSASAEMPALPGSAAWFAQTPYGMSFYAATAPYRSMRYIPSVRRGHYPSAGYGGYLRGW
jgi:hypothetical protein